MARPNRRTRTRLATARRQAREDARRAAGSQGRGRRAVELTLPVPPDMGPDELRAALADFAGRVRELGLELGDVHVCTSPECSH